TIDATKVSADLTDFPVLIDLNDTDLHDSAKVQTDGDDIVFTTASGVKLDHEIELFDQTGNGTHAHLVAWVRIPSLSATEDTDLLMYYGNGAAESQENPEGVWSSDYLQVFHLDETSGNHSDIVSNSDTGIVHGSIIQDTLGMVGGSDDFQGLITESWIEISNSQQLISNSPFTVGAWIYLDSLHSAWIGLVQKGREGNQNWYGLWLDGTNNLTFGWDWQSAKGGNVHGNTLSAGQWYYAVATYDGTNRNLYLDGSLDAGPSTGWYETDSVNWHIGTDGNGNYFDGKMDEIRISNKARSAGWISTEYQNQLNPDTFYSISNEEINNNWWVDGSFRYRKTIIINSTKVSADLTNFPFLIDVTHSDLKSGRVQSDADDILFFDQTGAKLDHEIENFQQNSSLGHLIAWVRVPSLSSISDTNITMYYGNSAVNSQENPEGVWNNNYAGVWHLSETSGGSLAIKDSTANYNHGTDYGTVELGISGQIDGGIGIDAYADYISIADSNSLDITTNLTLSVWTWANYDQWSLPIIEKNGSQYTPYGIRYINNSNQINYNLEGVTASQVDTGVTADREVWIYVVLTFDGSSVYIYKNGNLEYSASKPGTITSNNAPLLFGREESYGDTYRGFMDEIRISNSKRSSDWVNTSYNNQYDPTSFISVTSEEVHPYWWADASFGKRKDIAIAKEKVSGDLSNFPVLIDIYDSDLRTDVQADAADLMFTDSSNTKLAHEIELFDQTGNGTHAHLIAWVNVPTLFNNTDTLVSMYYGNNTVSHENSEAVWDSNYVGVWHLNQDPSGTSPQIKDSTTSSTHGTSYGSMASNDLVLGKIGNALDLDGTDDYIDFGNPSEVQITGALTVETWFRADVDENEYVISKNGPGPDKRSWDLSFD
ncbi:MAG: DUF2341 domain-containing protein, partial [Candidatus Thorarchaeota archaeon]